MSKSKKVIENVANVANVANVETGGPAASAETAVPVEETPVVEPEKTKAIESADQLTRTAHILGKLFENSEDPASIRQLSLATGCSYNVLLKASKAPIPGEMYDPDSVNYSAMAACVIRKLSDAVSTFEWDDVKAVGPDSNGGKAIEVQLRVGDTIKLRDVVTKDEGGNTVTTELPPYVVHIVTPTHIVIMAADETKPRVMSLATYVHCGGKVIASAPDESCDAASESATSESSN